LEKKLFKLISQILEVPLENINRDSSPDTIMGWDSLKHINLVLAIEQDFNVQFKEQQIVEMLNVDLIIEILREHKIEI